MSCLNVDLRWFSDPRRTIALKITKAEEHHFDGAMLHLWRTAESYCRMKVGSQKGTWIPDRVAKLFPYIETIIEVGLAEWRDTDRGRELYVSGCQQYFDWIQNKSNAGRAGGKKPKKTRSKKQTEANESKTKQTEANESKTKQTEANESKTKQTEAFSFSFSSSSPLASGSSTAEGGEKASPTKVDTGPTWHAYSEAYLKKYGTYPHWDPQVGGQIATFIRKVGHEEAPYIAEHYVNLSEQYYSSRMHPVGALLSDVAKLRTQWKTGAKVSQADLRQRDKATAAEMQRERILRGEL